VIERAGEPPRIVDRLVGRSAQHGLPVEPAPAVGAEREVERGGRLLVVGEVEVGLLDLLARQLGLEVHARQQRRLLVVGERQHGVVDRRDREVGRDRRAVGAARLDGDPVIFTGSHLLIVASVPVVIAALAAVVSDALISSAPV